MMKNSPLLSVIIPAYNHELYLAEAIESVRAQKYQPLEIIVVDDGSTDNTKHVAASFRNVQYVYQHNQGPASARNTGLELAHGELISFLDSDDFWSENKLEIQAELLSKNPSVDMVIGYLQFVRLSETIDGKRKLVPFLEPWAGPSMGTALIRCAVFEKVGFMDDTQLYDDDVDWFLRAMEIGISILIHQDVTYFYRRHENNITNQRIVGQQYLLKAVKKSLDRRRQDSSGSIAQLSQFFDFDLSAIRRIDSND